MPTVNKTWGFHTDTEGLVDAGQTSAITFGWDADQAEEPDQESGCVKWTGVGNSQTEKARRSSTGETWETWGVPSGKIVTSIRVSEWWKKVVNDDELVSAARVRIRVVDSSGNSVTGGNLINASPLGSTSWEQQSAGSSQSVLSGKQASTTDVRFELEMFGAVTNDDGTPFDIRLDAITLEITYQDDATPVSGSDSGAGADSAGISTSIPAGETASGAESAVVSAQIQASDSGAGTDSQAVSTVVPEVAVLQLLAVAPTPPLLAEVNSPAFLRLFAQDPQGGEFRTVEVQVARMRLFEPGVGVRTDDVIVIVTTPARVRL